MNKKFKLEKPAYACRCCGATLDQCNEGRERFLDTGQHLMRCEQCCVGYLAPDFTDAALDDFYTNHYRWLFLFDATAKHDDHFFKHTLYRESAAARAVLMAKQLPQNAKLLEIGSGFGGFIGQLFHLRPDIKFYAIEGDVEHRSMLLDGATVNFIARDEVGRNGPFDAIVAFHVVEHMKNPVQDMMYFTQKLSLKGVMVIEVPDSLADWGGWFFVQPAHVSYFTPNALRRMFQRAGVRIDTLGQHPGGRAFTAMIWAVVGKGQSTSTIPEAATSEENAQFARHIARYRYGPKQALRKYLKMLAVAVLGPNLIGARQRRGVYRAQSALYEVTINRR